MHNPLHTEKGVDQGWQQSKPCHKTRVGGQWFPPLLCTNSTYSGYSIPSFLASQELKFCSKMLPKQKNSPSREPKTSK